MHGLVAARGAGEDRSYFMVPTEMKRCREPPAVENVGLWTRGNAIGEVIEDLRASLLPGSRSVLSYPYRVEPRQRT